MAQTTARSADVLVIGAGAFGAATAYYLARRGARVVVVERHAIGSQTSPRAAGIAATIRKTRDPVPRVLAEDEYLSPLACPSTT